MVDKLTDEHISQLTMSFAKKTPDLAQSPR